MEPSAVAFDEQTDDMYEYGFLIKSLGKEAALMKRRDSEMSDDIPLLSIQDEPGQTILKKPRPSRVSEDWWVPSTKDEKKKTTYKPKEELVGKPTTEEILEKETKRVLFDRKLISAMSFGEILRVRAEDEEEAGKEKEDQWPFDDWYEEDLEQRATKYYRSFFVEAKEEVDLTPKLVIYRNINYIYQFRSRIRNGTYTTINKYFSRILMKDVAIKIIPKIGIPNDRLFKFVPRELDLAEDKDFQHPNIVRFIETHDTGLRCYIMMEYVDHGTLSDYIKSRGRLDSVTYRKFFSHLINAVDYCHEYGMCHRKLSAENCLITHDQTLKLCDFSYSRPVEEKELSDTFCGVLGYTAPEVLMCRAYEPFKADSWSCGVILFVMIYGAMPFDSTYFARMVKQVMKPIKYRWYSDTPFHAIMIMYKMMSPIRRRWSVKRVIGHCWVTPRPTDGLEYYKKWYKKETAGPTLPEMRRRLKALMDLIKRDYVAPLQEKQRQKLREEAEQDSDKEPFDSKLNLTELIKRKGIMKATKTDTNQDTD